MPTEPASTPKGARVWLDLHQSALDAAYHQPAYAPNMAEVLQRYADNSNAVRARIGAPRRLAYGNSATEQLDIYPASRTNAPVVVFLHGGAWRGGQACNYAFPAAMLQQAGAMLVVPDFAAVQDVDGNLRAMADQVRRAVAWVHRHAAQWGGDPDRIHLAGHSSGAHLAAVLLTTDWAGMFDLPADILKSGLCCSGIYDLRPVRLSARGAYIRFTDEMEQALSPQRHLAWLNAPLTVAYGTLETPEFQRQARDFATAVIGAGKSVNLIVAPDTNHFEIIESLACRDGLLGRALLAQLGLGA